MRARQRLGHCRHLPRAPAASPQLEGVLPVVLLHGVGTDRAVWDGWLPTLQEDHPVCAADLRGLDGVDALPTDPAELLDLLVQDVLAAAPMGGRAHLVGESTGGVVCLAAALRHPERVASVTLCNAPIRGSQTGPVSLWPALFAQGAPAWSADMMQRRFAPGAVDAETARRFAARQEQTDPAAALALGTMLKGMDLRAQLPGLAVALLVLLPGDSSFIPVESFDGLTDLVPDAEVHLFPGVRHGLVLSHAEACAGLLADFLGRVERP